MSDRAERRLARSISSRRLALTFALVIVLTRPLFAFDLHASVDPLADDALSSHTAVGVVVGIYKDGETQVLGYGEVAKGSGVRPDGDTVYEIGSITKTFTGILVAGQVLRGQMRLEAPIQDYLPTTVRLPPVPGGPVTVRHLVTHTGGFPHRPDNLDPPDRANPYANYTPEAMYAFLAGYRPSKPLGTYSYSNIGMGLAGYLVQLQTGRTYASLIAERITGPLTMQDTTPLPTADMRKRLAPPYTGKLGRTKSWDYAAPLAGAGGIRSTMHDLLKYARANLTPDGSPLGRAIALSHEKQGTRDHGKPIAVAWRVSANGKVFTHGGQTAGYRAWVALMPDRQVGVVLLANGSGFKVTTLGEKVFAVALRTLKGTASATAPMVDESDSEPEEPDAEE